jgi:hypothetical protein
MKRPEMTVAEMAEMTAVVHRYATSCPVEPPRSPPMY